MKTKHLLVFASLLAGASVMLTSCGASENSESQEAQEAVEEVVAAVDSSNLGDDLSFLLAGSNYYIFTMGNAALQQIPAEAIAYNFGSDNQSRCWFDWAANGAGSFEPVGLDPFALGEGWSTYKMTEAGWVGSGLCVALLGDSSQYAEAAAKDLIALNQMTNTVNEELEDFQYVLVMKSSEMEVPLWAQIYTGIDKKGNAVMEEIAIDDAKLIRNGKWQAIIVPCKELKNKFTAWESNGANVIAVGGTGTVELSLAMLYKPLQH